MANLFAGRVAIAKFGKAGHAVRGSAFASPQMGHRLAGAAGAKRYWGSPIVGPSLVLRCRAAVLKINFTSAACRVAPVLLNMRLM